MKRTLVALLGGIALSGMISTAEAEVNVGLFDANRNAYVEPTEFMTGLDTDGFFDLFVRDRDGFLGLNEINDREEGHLGVYDLNRDWRIDRTEYCGGMFNTYDMNRDGLARRPIIRPV